MINYNKNDLINETLDQYYTTFAHTLDTGDYVPDKFNDKIRKYIFKNMKGAFRKINKEDRSYQKELRKEEKAERKAKKAEEKAQKRENVTPKKPRWKWKIRVRKQKCTKKSG